MQVTQARVDTPCRAAFEVLLASRQELQQGQGGFQSRAGLAAQNGAGRCLQGSCSGRWAEGWRAGAPKLSHSTWLLSVYWAASRFNGPARRPWALRGTIDKGGASLLPQLLQLSWALGAWGSVGPGGVPAHPSPPTSLRWG